MRKGVRSFIDCVNTCHGYVTKQWRYMREIVDYLLLVRVYVHGFV